jgi:glycopeptide antibiotics resistance protein
MSVDQNSVLRFLAPMVLLIGLAWRYRKDKFILFGVICAIFFEFSLIATKYRADDIVMIFAVGCGISAFAAIGFGIEKFVQLLKRKHKRT